MASAFGWTWEYIDEYVTVPRLLEINEYWSETPPLAEAVAALLGAGAGISTRAPSTVPSGDDNPAFFAELAASGFTMAPAPLTPRPAPTTDG